MSRTVPAALLTALAQPEVQPFYAVEMLFDAGPVRLWTGYGNRSLVENSYIGAGTLLNIQGLGEVADLSAKSITISLSGVAASLVSLALQEPYQRRVCRVYFGAVDVADVVEVFSGQLNTMSIEDSGETSTISVLVDSKLVELERASNRRYTSENQKSRFAGDTFLDYVSAIQDAEIVWGRKSA
jgi:hypothetical protein